MGRPACPDCGEPMIFVAIDLPPEPVEAWVCDCRNKDLAEEILECRAEPSPDASFAISIQSFVEEYVPPLSVISAGHFLEYYHPN